MDVKELKIAGQGCFQYAALNDCARYRVLRLYRAKNHATSLHFFEAFRQAFPFVIQKVQVDNGTECSLAFRLAVQAAGIGLRYIKPHRPEQNGKVERSHRIDDEEFWRQSTFDAFGSAATVLLTWERRYNHERFSMALNGLTPAEKLATFRRSPPAHLVAPRCPHALQRPASAMDSVPIIDPGPNMKPTFLSNRSDNRRANS